MWFYAPFGVTAEQLRQGVPFGSVERETELPELQRSLTDPRDETRARALASPPETAIARAPRRRSRERATATIRNPPHRLDAGTLL
jgi:hypothetical protein